MNITEILNERGIQSPYLNYAKNIYTQNGEDGIIEKLFDELGIIGGNVVEFGAWDGIYLSNVYRLWRYKKFNALLIEGNLDVTSSLKLISDKYKVEVVEAYVSSKKEDSNSLDNILSNSSLNFDDDNFSLLSIDIDGLDYYVWESLTMHRPKIVICETNWRYGFSDRCDDGGCSLKPLVKLANEKGYKLVCHNLNGIFVREDLFDKLMPFDNDESKIYVGIDDIVEVLQRVDENGNLKDDFRYLSDEYKSLIEKEKADL